MSTAALAAAFVKGDLARRTHNAEIRPGPSQYYVLHGHAIALRFEDKTGACVIQGDWCGYYTQTTQRHLTAILNAAREAGLQVTEKRLSARFASQQADCLGYSSTFVIAG